MSAIQSLIEAIHMLVSGSSKGTNLCYNHYTPQDQQQEMFIRLFSYANLYG